MRQPVFTEMGVGSCLEPRESRALLAWKEHDEDEHRQRARGAWTVAGLAVLALAAVAAWTFLV